ncbi:hypothetical protein [Actinokineospora globicatena]|uniref:hypothetical protein n=1 Tax=Actinokineospora globicatena TaxID=103729 RepID=UPI0020A52AB9|nr:hypothetical protein [Actinokineospora globicatena]MCP2304110.1 hypothetical protein [Actinokineospora globicatena]GLW78538.1 hypothetical protein Aglo01_30200 [Actinokineospora globicatena]GLW84798.1 hypothetical protein Aglo02_24380 [Actinokineospora globicatena]
MTTPESQALAAYPELQHLIDLRDTGWTFHVAANDGHITQIYGHHHWPDGWTDLLVIHHHTDAAAARSTPDGGLVWTHDGDLVEVITHLTALPDPDEPLAPQLIIGRAPTLWTP